MNAVETAWTMMAASCLTLGLIHLYVWRKQRLQYGSLLFFVLTVSIACAAVYELRMMGAATPAEYAAALRWAQLPVTVAILSIVGFVRFHFGSGRIWLAFATCLVRLVALAANFLTGVNLNFERITALDHVPLWGSAVAAVPVGLLNPWWLVAQLGNLLLTAFIVDASLSLWHRGDVVSRRRALVLGGSLTLCVLFTASVALLVFSGRLHAPTALTPAFFIVVLAVAYELGQELVQAAQLSRDLRESELRTELAAQAAGLAFWSWDPAHRELWLSPLGRRIFGLAESGRVDPETLLARMHPDDQQAVRRELDNTVRHGGTFEREFRAATTGGEARWVAIRGQLDPQARGTPGLLRGVAFDITERVRMEREVAQHRNELAHIARVSTLGELAGSLAHEINQPLMAILANAETAQSLLERLNPADQDLRDILADIVDDDMRAGMVIQRLRELLRKGEVQLLPLDLNGLVGDVLRLMRTELLHRGITPSASLAPRLPAVLADRVQIQQVLINLVMNACDAMSAVGGARELRIATRLSARDGVELSVTDCGGGIAIADFERIFEPFFTTKKQGMGLGLSVCRTIVAAHGGRLWAENNAGAGATLRVTLPLAAAAS
jgi:two-component system, LuxR family, sensor kinase FixL